MAANMAVWVRPLFDFARVVERPHETLPTKISKNLNDQS